jgi:hypothetical protein
MEGIKKISRIWGSHGREDKDGCLLVCSAVESGETLPAFLRSVVPPSSGRSWYQTTRRYNPEDSHLHLKICCSLSTGFCRNLSESLFHCCRSQIKGDIYGKLRQMIKEKRQFRCIQAWGTRGPNRRQALGRRSVRPPPSPPYFAYCTYKGHI